MRTHLPKAREAPLRVLQIVDTLDAGGMEAQLVALMNRLDPQQFQFEVCCLRHEGVHAASLRTGIRVHALQKKEGFQWRVVRQIRTFLSRGFDLVHTHNLAPLIYAVLATGGGTSCPIFHGEHSQLTSQEQTPKRLWQRRLLYRFAHAIHTVSAGQRAELLHAGLNHPRLVSILNGVNLDRFCPLSHETERSEARARLGLGGQEEFWIGIVARFGAFKGHSTLIRAFETLAPSHPNLRLLLVGDGGPQKDTVLAQMRKSPATAAMRWAGYQKDPAPYFQTLDLLVVPSSNEGLSNTTLEAMASALPVLTNDICGASELIAEGEGGWVRDLRTPDYLANELSKIVVLEESERRSVGALGRKRATEHFSWSAMGHNYAEWFTICAARSIQPHPQAGPSNLTLNHP